MSVVTMSFSVIPKVKDGNTYPVVDAALDVVKQSGVVYEVGAMETTMEGDMNHLIEIVKDAQEACVKAGAIEVITAMKIHYRPNGEVTIDEKISKHR